MDKTATGRIKIIKVPEGQMPYWVRKAWVDLILPAHPYMGSTCFDLERGVIDGKDIFEHRIICTVPQREALMILKESDPKAAHCWFDLGFPKAGKCFGFAKDEVEIISGVTEQQTRQIPDLPVNDDFLPATWSANGHDEEE